MSRFAAALVALSFPFAASAAARQRSVAIVVHEGVELLDFAGPGEVFASAGQGAFKVFTVAPSRSPIMSQDFLKIVPDYSIDDSPKPDIVVVPGGRTAVLYEDAKFMAWLKKVAAEDEITLSVCTGAVALARAGLLDGLQATTHYGSLAALKKFPAVTVVPAARFVDNGRIVTTQGVSAGIDGALHVVQRLLGDEEAWATARYMMYAWEPDGPMAQRAAPLEADAKEELRALVFQEWGKLASLAQRRLATSPDDAGALTHLGLAQQGLGKHDEAIATLQRALAQRPDLRAQLALATAQYQAQHYLEAAKSFERAGELGRATFQPQYGAACSYALAGDREAAMRALQKAIEAGMPRGLAERDSDFDSLRGDQRFASLLQKAR